MTLAWPTMLEGSAAAQETWTVTPGSTGACDTTEPTCATIQAAINEASAGDTIKVAPGAYDEDLVVDKTLTLLGAQAGVDARTRNTAASEESVIRPATRVQDFAPGVTLDGFTIEGAAYYGFVTNPSNGGYQIVNNIFEGNDLGLWFNSSGPESVVRHNLFRDNTVNGIYSDLELSNALIDSNVFRGNGYNSISIDQSIPRPTGGNNIRIRDNVGDGGIDLVAVNGLAIERNTLSAANGHAIGLLGGNHDVAITGNNITNSQAGITFTTEALNEPNSGIGVDHNIITGNGTGTGVEVEEGSSATLVCNTFSGWNTNLTGVTQPPCITTEQVPEATAGEAYSATLKAHTPNPPVTWSLAPGSSLPPGLTFNSDGTITGTPTEAGTFTFTAVATDAIGDSSTHTFTITINPAVVPPAPPRPPHVRVHVHVKVVVVPHIRITLPGQMPAVSKVPVTG